jgi:hypothetical protein
MAWNWCTAARVITKRPCILKTIIMTPSAANAECKIYDGESDKDPPIGEIYSSTQITRGYEMNGGIETRRGLYVGGFTNVTGVLVIWEPIGEGKA